jgi:ribosomal protein S18 acetylase RimI-like enzyme
LHNQGNYVTQAAFYFIEEENKEVILGLIMCEWRYVDKFFFEFVGDNILEEINKSIDYEEEVQFFLSKQKFYTSNYILSLGVIDECRKMNIGTNLIKFTFNYAISVPFCIGFFLNVIVDNFSGKKFYEKNGLICSNRLKDFYVIEDKKYDSDVYVRIFDREKKNLANKYYNSFLNWKQNLFRLFILKPFYFLVKLFLIFCLCRCFKRKIKYD